MDGNTDTCELVLWRQQNWRCELWKVAGRSLLRLYDRAEVVRQRPFRTALKAWNQAEQWRARRTGYVHLLKQVKALHHQVERLHATATARQHDAQAELWQLRRELEATRVALQSAQRLSERLD